MSAAIALRLSHWTQDRSLCTRIDDGTLSCLVRTSELASGAGIVSEVTLGGRTVEIPHTSCAALSDGFVPARAFPATHHDEVIAQVLAGKV